jgi:phospholipase/carboxylesterase
MTLSRHDDLSLRYVLNVPSGRKDDIELPLVILMHGRGADANDLADIAPSIDGGYRFIFPNAKRPFEPYRGMTFGFSWFDGWPPTRESIAESRELILKFIDEALERYPTPPGKLILAGFSQGALMALDCGFRTKQQVAGIVSMSGALYEEELPNLSDRKNEQVLIVHGSEDEVIPVIAARRTRNVLEEHGLNPEYHEFAMGHWVTEDSMRAVGNFIARVFGVPLA